MQLSTDIKWISSATYGEESKTEPFSRGKTLEALAEKITVPASSLAETVTRYNRYVEQKEDLEFGKNAENLSHKLQSAPFWAVRVEMMIHETLGRLVVDPFCRVLTEDGHPIKGLYAAGSIIGNRMAITDSEATGFHQPLH